MRSASEWQPLLTFLVFALMSSFVVSSADKRAHAGHSGSSSPRSSQGPPLLPGNLSRDGPIDALCVHQVHLPMATSYLAHERSGSERAGRSSHLSHFTTYGRLQEGETSKWLKATSLLEPIYWPLKDKIADALQSIAVQVPALSNKCKMSLQLFVEHLERGDSTAFQMMDSFGSYGSSLFTHGVTSLGDYSQCINSKFNSSFARYTLIQLHLPLPRDQRVVKMHKVSPAAEGADWQFEYSHRIGPLRFIPQVVSVCLPSQCSPSDIRDILTSHLVVQSISPITLTLFSSESKAEPFFEETSATSMARIALISLIIFTLVATYMTHKKRETMVNNVAPGASSSALAAFDIVENSRRLLAEPVCDVRLHFFSGYKVMYLLLCTLGHSTVPLTRPIMIEGIFPHFYITTDLFSRVFSNATGFVITTNFLVTAMLSMIAILPEVKRRKGRVSIVSLILLRALRTLPGICAYIMLVMSLPWVQRSSEPLVNPVQKDILRRCSANWWREILFISNTIDILDTCHQFAWFISADMQISIVSSVAVVLFYARPMISILLIALQLIASMALQYFYLQWKGITPKLLIFSLDANSIWTGFRDIYVKTVTYVPSYTIGLAIGMLIANSVVIRNRNLLKWLMIASTVSLIAVTASPTLLYTDKYFNLPLSWESAYAVLSNSLHSLSIGTLIYCIYHHPYNPIVRFFSCKPFVVISRLTFSAFIVQPLILLFTRKNRYSSLTQLQDGVFNFIACLLFGFLLYVTVEAPFYNLTKFMLKPSPPKGPITSSAPITASASASASCLQHQTTSANGDKEHTN